MRLIFNKVNGYLEYLNGNKYLTLVPIDESKEKIKKYEELWIKIRNLIRSITKIWDDYDEKYMKIKFNSDEKLLLNKTIDIPNMTIIVRATFLEMINVIRKFLRWMFIKIIAISINYYLVKYKAKQKHLLPFYVTNNKLKKVLY